MIDWVLIIVSSLRILVMIMMAVLLLKKWKEAEKRFLTDIPFLMASFFLLWGLAKIIDVYIFYNYTLEQAAYPEGLLFTLGKTRAFFLALEAIPMWIMAVLIWFPNKKRVQFVLSIAVTAINLTLVITMKTYQELMATVRVVLIPVIILHFVTYVILNQGRRLPTINSLFLAIGFFSMLVSSILYPYFRTDTPVPWGYVWIHELLELIIVLVLGYGFLTPAKYSIFFENNQILNKQTIKS